MENLLNFLLLIAGFIGGLFLRNLFPSYMKKKGENIATKEDIAEITQLTENVKAEIEKDIETHRQGLDIEIETLRLEQNQLMASFELYTAKRHECYPELYKLIEISNGSIRGLRGLQRELTFQNTNSEDIESYMKGKQFTSNDIQLILRIWDEDKPSAISLLRETLGRTDYYEAEEKFTNANNYFYFMNLYLSENVENIVRELLELLHELWINYDSTFPVDLIKISGEHFTNEEGISKIDSLRRNLKSTMRRELMPN